jgi:hypothetical protein
MQARKIGYWSVTALFAFALGGSGIADLVHAPAIVEGFGVLGYPEYLMDILGVWKLLGMVALLAPGFPRLKEWAYAGFFFHLTGALASHLFTGDTAIAPLLVLLALGVASWALRPEDRVLGKLSLPSRAPMATPATAS